MLDSRFLLLPHVQARKRGHFKRGAASDTILLFSMYFLEFVMCLGVMLYRVCVGVSMSVQHNVQVTLISGDESVCT